MNSKPGFTLFFLVAGLLFITKLSPAQRIMERLNRGTIAVTDSSGVFISWRLLATDPQNISFNVYRNQLKINFGSIKNTTCFLDQKGTINDVYQVVAIIDGKEEKNL